MVPSPTMSLSIHSPPPIINMNTHLPTYRKAINNQTSLITGQKITANKQY